MLRWFVGFFSAALFAASSSFAQERFADSVVDFRLGAGYASAFTNAAVVLGEPSRVTPGAFGGPVDPFDPAYLPSQLLSVGSNGFLTVEFAQPIRNDPAHPFGLDFIIFGNSGFIITNGDYSGGGITDGSIFGNNRDSRVSVSADNSLYYQLNPATAPPVDGLFPTDGSGDFSRPVSLNLAGPDFGGMGLDQIRGVYQGSGGGTGFDISWARDGDGAPVGLDSIRFIRVDVTAGHAEIDGFAAVPEPGISWLMIAGLVVLFCKLGKVSAASAVGKLLRLGEPRSVPIAHSSGRRRRLTLSGTERGSPSRSTVECRGDFVVSRTLLARRNRESPANISTRTVSSEFTPADGQ